MSGLPQDRDAAPETLSPPPLVVQILGQLFFGIFAIVATVMAFEAFWLAGLALAIVLAVHGFGRRSEFRFSRRTKARSKVADEPEIEQPKSSGNASFDAYRAEVLKRLEDEQKTFVSFLDRLRDAKDKSEFDAFMNERSRPSVPVAQALSGSDSLRNGEY
jgi:hypothetical protein